MLARKNRFHGRSAVARVKGSTVHSKLLSIRVQRNQKSDYRVAVVVSKKIDPKAVGRNKIRRRIFEAIRVQGALHGLSVDVVMYVKSPDVAALSAEELAHEVNTTIKMALQRLHLQRKPQHDIVESRRK